MRNLLFSCLLILPFSLVAAEDSFNENMSLKYGLYSAVLPGFGQFKLYKDTKDVKFLKKSLFFLTIESTSIFFTKLFHKKYEQQIYDYKNYANHHWDFGRWIYNYEDFQSTDLSYLWETLQVYDDGTDILIWKDIGSGSHSIKFTIGNGTNVIESNIFDENFLIIKDDIINFIESGSEPEEIYSEFGIDIRKDQHFYENIGKYNEYFSGWSDANITNTTVVITDHGYATPRSPIKSTYLEQYNNAESLSDVSELSKACIYFNHFISMIDAFILSRKKNRNLSLSSSTIYDQGKKNKTPIGVIINLKFKI